MNKIKGSFDKLLKLLMVFTMSLSCFTDFPVRVVAETLSVDSVISIESDGSGTDVNDSDQAILTVHVDIGGQTISESKTVTPGTLTITAKDGYAVDSSALNGTGFTGSTTVEAGESVLTVSAHATAIPETEEPE